MFKKIWKFTKERWALVVGIVLTWAIPIYLLSEEIALVKEVSKGIKITFAGIVVAGVLFLKFRKTIYGKLIAMKHGISRGLLLFLHRGTSYGFVFGLLWGITHFADKLYNWWLISGIAIGTGALFYILDELMFTIRKNKKGEVVANETNNI